MKLAIKSGVSYTCNYFFIDSSASWGMVSHDVYPCYDNPSQLQSWEKIITRKTPRGNVQNGMLVWVSKCVSACGCGSANVCTIVCVLTCCSVWAVSEHPSTLTLVLSSSNNKVLDLMYKQWLITVFLSLSLSLSLSCHPAFSLPVCLPLQVVRTGGRWDLPALCWSCCTSRCPRV